MISMFGHIGKAIYMQQEPSKHQTEMPFGITGRNSIGYSQNENWNPTVSNKIVITITITPNSIDSTSHFRFFVIIHKI